MTTICEVSKDQRNKNILKKAEVGKWGSGEVGSRQKAEEGVRGEA